MQGYDRIALEYHTLEERQDSLTIHLRHFNNWIKSALIDDYCPKNGSSILDLACGKGGDIPKLALKYPSKIFFADISEESLKQVVNRLLKRKLKFKSSFIVGDSFKNDILPIFNNTMFHFSICQFALHYSFINEEVAKTAIKNLTNNLYPGGKVIITTLNAPKLVRIFREQEKKGLNEEDKCIVKNSVFYMKRLFDINEEIPLFGAEYIFNLDQSVDETPEYLVHPQLLINLFLENDLELYEMYSFHDYYNYCIKNRPEKKKLFYDLLRKADRNHRDKDGIHNAEMSDDEWFVCGLYSLYVFQKKGELPPIIPEKNYNYSHLDKFIFIEAESKNKRYYEPRGR